MKSLYLRIVLTTFAIMVISSLLAFFASNLYYQVVLKPYNDKKNTRIALDVVQGFHGQHGEVSLDSYLKGIAGLSYQMYLVDERGKATSYGKPFRKTELAPGIVDSVQKGQVYHGMAHYPFGLFVTGFFENELQNSIGVPVEYGGSRYALFIRPDVENQFGEMRIFLAILLILTLGFSFLLVAASTRMIVRPVTILTEATKKIAEGNYRIELYTSRQDEIGNLARHFSMMANSLERLEAMRQEFVSNVSHEIQSPLASIQGFSQTLRTESLPEEEREQYLSIIENESRRLSSLSKQLLMLASLDKEETALDQTEFDVAAQIREVLRMLEWNWRDKELAIKTDLPPTRIRADAKLLHQVWTNLLNNAIKFTEPGGTITVTIDDFGEGGIEVKVRDTGVGIPGEDLPHIFERFYKADKSRSRKGKESGSGLGLSVVKKVVDLHGGTISVESEPGAGTGIRVWLPGK
ncbi:sensor histidine kinase [Kroppenstedtia eburnea]|uniref:Heme sensor protein HssS n=1 Tax=Kroppenstedtia eburnea TaxID=714067 RepID=A0A1N7NCL1_9BACL|nr:HAMP domain-containing sensor histidine kinase [Kroppenstedtia eburnea]QKI83075.1 HAMP domain-containing protein [Kroppenstedtia eburnea]SIS96056.1 Signal transduction histidine kinase [Kroppenstedtia eburnea]